MKAISPGQAAIGRHEGRICIVICEREENFPLWETSFDIKGKLHQVTIQGVTVAALRFTFILKSPVMVQNFGGWINELEEGVLESLAALTELTVVMATPDGMIVATPPAKNTLQRLAHSSLPMFSELASIKPWSPAHFAGAVAFLEAGGQ